MDKEDVKAKWEDYIIVLYNDIRNNLQNPEDDINGPTILTEEVENAIKYIKRVKLWEKMRFLWKMIEAT